MDGAYALDMSVLQGKYLLNLDSEEEGTVLASCAGGLRKICTLPVERREAEDGQGAQGEYVLVTAGYAVIRDGVLRGFTDRTAAFGADLLRSMGKGQVLELSGPDRGYTALKITGVKTTFRTVFEGDTLTGLRVACALETQAAELSGAAARLGEEDRLALEGELSRLAGEAMEAAMESFRADAIHLLDRVALAVPWKQATLEKQWQEVFPNLTLEVEVEATVARS